METEIKKWVPCSMGNTCCPTESRAKEAFSKEGITLADYQLVNSFTSLALTNSGTLYRYDAFHGGGGVFIPE